MGDLPVLMEYVIPSGYSRQDYWNSLGIGVLKDVLDIKVTEDLGGVFQFEMQYPEDGKLAKEIKIGRVIKVRTRQDMTKWEEANFKEPGNNGLWEGAFYHRLGWEYQPFYINDIEYDVSGIFIVRGVHYTYRIGELYYSLIRSDKIPKENQIMYGIKRPFQILGDAWSRFSLIDSYYQDVYSGVTFLDHNGATATADVTKGSVTLGATTIYQDIKQYSELDPWNDRRPDNWAPKTFELTHRNFGDILLGDDEKSMRKVYNFEVLRDRWGIVLTDRRTMKSWDEAYEIRYGRDMKNIKVDIDMSDILPAVFPYFIVEDEYTFRTEEVTTEWQTPKGGGESKEVEVRKMVDKTVTCRMEVNFRGTVFPFPAHSSGNYILVPRDKWPNYMFKGIRKDITEYVDIEAIKQKVKQYRQSDGTYFSGGFTAAQFELEKNAPEYLRRANIQFGEATAEIDFLPLWETSEAIHKPALQKLRLGDPVVIVHEPLQLRIYARVTETDYNPLTDKYNSIKIKSYSVVPLD
ncbi:phage tail spike protein [Bacillus cereus]|uniref:phage tail spike protein n=1 Tax=Bacillus cereus TaxID=1396 RepID=UPI003D99B1CA